jgi:hypothetical protein
MFKEREIHTLDDEESSLVEESTALLELSSNSHLSLQNHAQN